MTMLYSHSCLISDNDEELQGMDADESEIELSEVELSGDEDSRDIAGRIRNNTGTSVTLIIR